MSEGPRSLFGSLQRLADQAMNLVQTRAELFVVELEEEKCRFIHLLLLAAAVITMGVMTMALVSVVIILLFWDTGRLAALGVLSGLYALGTILLLRALNQRLKSRGAFEGTLAELKKDRECLRSRD